MTRTLRTVPLSAVRVADDFWSPRRERNREVTLDHQYRMLDRTGRTDNFRRAAEEHGEFEGRFYNDSDVYKWIEATSDVLATGDEPDPERLDRLGDVVDAVVAAQEPDGYLNTYFTLERPEGKWTNFGLNHELYCAGHLFEAAVAHYRATGSERLLDVARRLADHVEDAVGPGGKRAYPGHEEIELALVRLADATGVDRYRDLAALLVDRRGTEPSRFAWELENPGEIAEWRHDVYVDLFGDGEGGYDGRYAQDHAPVREQTTAEGHAVRATYLYAAMADLAAERDDEALAAATRRLHANVTRRRMYVTGGIGASAANEGFTGDYDLPNADAYAETCAAVGFVRWSHRLCQLTGEAAYADALERTLYNGFLAGVGLDGDAFFYRNPLASDGDHHREEWFETACCPPNAARLLAALGRYVYLRGDGDGEREGDGHGGVDPLAVNLYVGGEVTVPAGGTDVTVRVETGYPWDGTVTLTVAPGRDGTALPLALRVPGWCRAAPALSVNGDARDLPDLENGYLTVDREWSAGDTVTVEFPMAPVQLEADPRVDAAAGRVALARGPLVYCVEAVDAPRPVDSLRLPEDAALSAVREPELLDGVTVLEGEALATAEPWEEDDPLYRERAGTERVPFRAIPYYAWDHREPGGMRVWLDRA